MQKENLKKLILELTSEDAYGSWELWRTVKDKLNAEKENLNEMFLQTIKKLIDDGELLAFHHKQNGSYDETSLDVRRLMTEIEKSANPDPETFYWFGATKKGTEEDLRLRSSHL